MDRNTLPLALILQKIGSLSARRAWIEMQCQVKKYSGLNLSLSARRAWIEIGVDFAEDWLNAGRSPQGERG